MEIAPGDSLDMIANRLREAHLIRSTIAFKMMVGIRGLTRKIQAGSFTLSQAMTLKEITQALTRGRSDIKVTLIEGVRAEEMAQALQKQFEKENASFDAPTFIKLAKDSEGFLFPDTYIIPKQTTEAKVVDLLTTTFHKKTDEKLLQAITNQGLSLREAVTLASLVEREVRTNPDRPLVAGILIKRARNNWPLQVDASVQYALGYDHKERSWWKKNLTKDDLAIDSPYNTYKVTGLPPTPISNPSLSSLEAVAYQKPSPYWFYLSDGSGNLHYAKTIEEHNRNIATYLNK